jgi:hypothetical protein
MVENEHTTVSNNSREKLKTFKYLDSLLTNENSVQEKTKLFFSPNFYILDYSPRI